MATQNGRKDYAYGDVERHRSADQQIFTCVLLDLCLQTVIREQEYRAKHGNHTQ